VNNTVKILLDIDKIIGAEDIAVADAA
jgi:hypothetical protein